MNRLALLPLLILPLALTGCPKPAEPPPTVETRTDEPLQPLDRVESTHTTPPPSSVTMTPSPRSEPAPMRTVRPSDVTPSEPVRSAPMTPADPAPRTAKRSSSSGSSGAGGTYTVQKGDTLTEISQKVYGTSTKWKQIWNANKARVPDPNKLKVGTKLIIP